MVKLVADPTAGGNLVVLEFGGEDLFTTLEQRQGGSSSRPKLFRGRSQRCRRPLGWRRWWTKASRRKRIGLRPRKLDRVDKGPVLQADAVGQGWVRVWRRVWVRR